MATRRAFLKRSGLALFAAGSAPLWLQRATAASSSRKKVLVAIFQRGAVDGLNVVVPFGDPAYAALRPNIAIPSPTAGDANAAIDLNGFFGLHPSLAPLESIWKDQKLAIVHAAGSPDATRSHFDAQDYMESGTPGRKSTTDGWLNRSLMPEDHASPVRAVSLGTTLARSLRGANPAIALQNVDGFNVHANSADFEQMYAQSSGALQGAGRDTFEAVKLIQSIRKTPYTPANGATYPDNPLGKSLQQVARLIKANVGLEAAFADMGGWDTHANQPAQLDNLLRQFGQALAAFYRDLGPELDNVAVVTMSEFGRTARENGARGTDHGCANVMFAFGGGIRGGKVYGEWPGLAQDQLHEERDLAITTDFRDVLGELAMRHLGSPSLSAVFPGYATSQFRGLLA